MKTYVVIDTRTGLIMGNPMATRARATSKADRLDRKYGGYRYSVQVEDDAERDDNRCPVHSNGGFGPCNYCEQD